MFLSGIFINELLSRNLFTVVGGSLCGSRMC